MYIDWKFILILSVIDIDSLAERDIVTPIVGWHSGRRVAPYHAFNLRYRISIEQKTWLIERGFLPRRKSINQG